MATTLDLIGGSSYVWRWKHTIIHHSYVNITDYDVDLGIEPFGRFTPYQKWRPLHRWQHIYLWPLYGLLAIKWHFFDDFNFLVRGGIGIHDLPRPRGWDLMGFFVGKLAFFGWALIIPMLLHPWTTVVSFYLLGGVVLGTTMSLIFQLPHCVGQAEFPLPDKSGKMKYSRSVHQAQVTLDYGRGNPVTTWLVGGLNYHLEHHLLPTVCSIHYPDLAPIVEQTCRDFNVKYAWHSSFLSGLQSHYRWLREMGRKQVAT